MRRPARMAETIRSAASANPGSSSGSCSAVSRELRKSGGLVLAVRARSAPAPSGARRAAQKRPARTRAASCGRNRQVRGMLTPSLRADSSAVNEESHSTVDSQRPHFNSRSRMFRKAASVRYEAMPNGRDASTSLRIEIFLPASDWLTIWSLSIQASILASVTRSRIVYQRPVSNSRYLVVEFSEASSPSMLERPQTPPPQPPMIRLHGSSLTGNVSPQKKSDPSTRRASSDDLVVAVGDGTLVIDAGEIVPDAQQDRPVFDLDGPFASELGRLPALERLAVKERRPSRLRVVGLFPGRFERGAVSRARCCQKATRRSHDSRTGNSRRARRTRVVHLADYPLPADCSASAADPECYGPSRRDERSGRRRRNGRPPQPAQRP